MKMNPKEMITIQEGRIIFSSGLNEHDITKHLPELILELENLKQR